MAQYFPQSVDVNIFREDRPVSSPGLEYPLAIVPHNLTANNVDSFSSLSSIVDAGAAVNSPLYNMAAGALGGSAAPDLFKVGRAVLTDIELEVTRLLAEDEVISVNCNVNGVATKVSYTVLVTDTTTTLIAAGLAAALTTAFPAANTSNPTFTSAGAVITAAPGTVSPYAISFGYSSADTSNVPDIAVRDTTAESPVTVVTRVQDEDKDFFYLLAESHDTTDVSALAVYAETNKMMYLTSTSDTNVADSGNTSNIGVTLSSAEYQNTFWMYSAQAEQLWPEAAVVGSYAESEPTTPTTLKFKTLKGVTADSLTEQQRITINSRNGNMYVKERGVSILKEGVVASGSFFDTSRFAIWIGLATGTALFSALKLASDRGTSVPYSDSGAGQLESRIWNDVINPGVRGGAILTGNTVDPITGSTINLDPIVDFGTRAQQTNTVISNRVWENAVVEVVYAGAIHAVDINVYVILNRDPQ